MIAWARSSFLVVMRLAFASRYGDDMSIAQRGLQGRLAVLASRRIGRGPYIALGLGLALFKIGLDQVASRSLRGEPWSPWNYLVWPFDALTQSLVVDAQPDMAFALAMLAIAVPFAVVGLTLTAFRLRDAGFAPIVAFFFLIPFANIAVILLACAAPRRAGEPATPPPPEIPREAVEAVIASLPRPSSVVLVAASFAGAFAMFLGGASAIFVQAFGFAVFFLAPALGGAVASALVGLDGCGGAGRGLLAATLVPLWFAIAIVLIGFDGLVCVLMATPLMLPLVLAGGAFGLLIQAAVVEASRQGRRSTLPLAIAIGASAASGLAPVVERALPYADRPPLRSVVTEVVVDAPIDAVWAQVVAFPAIAPPRDWLFRLGIAYPTHATIAPNEEGVLGPGAVRECVFSTGPFIEPITAWEPPHRLAFDVSEQPAPMRELSPWEIHPDHLDGHLASRRGEFLLEALPDGRTRLVGTTWYEVRMWPQLWWGGLSDAIIHRIHRRVLEHVRDEAEAQAEAQAQTNIATAPEADRARDRRDRTRASPPR